MSIPEFVHIENKYKNILYSDFVRFDDIKKLKNITGVYLIFDENDNCIYIGCTNKFHIRFGTDLNNETTHTLMRKWLKQSLFADRHAARIYLKNECKYKYEVCSNKREAEALECMCILIFNPKYNK
jgi:excinuclease UvrABC nuclease subunit